MQAKPEAVTAGRLCNGAHTSRGGLASHEGGQAMQGRVALTSDDEERRVDDRAPRGGDHPAIGRLCARRVGQVVVLLLGGRRCTAAQAVAGMGGARAPKYPRRTDERAPNTDSENSKLILCDNTN